MIDFKLLTTAVAVISDKIGSVYNNGVDDSTVDISCWLNAVVNIPYVISMENDVLYDIFQDIELIAGHNYKVIRLILLDLWRLSNNMVEGEEDYSVFLMNFFNTKLSYEPKVRIHYFNVDTLWWLCKHTRNYGVTGSLWEGLITRDLLLRGLSSIIHEVGGTVDLIDVAHCMNGVYIPTRVYYTGMRLDLTGIDYSKISLYDGVTEILKDKIADNSFRVVYNDIMGGLGSNDKYTWSALCQLVVRALLSQGYSANGLILPAYTIMANFMRIAFDDKIPF